MKPKTVWRVKSEQDSQTRAYPLHAGIVAGSIIFTAEGEIPVEYLSPGDKVVTRDSGMVTLLDTFIYRISAQAVAIKAGSLGHTRPDHNVIIPRSQCNHPSRTEYFGARLARPVHVWQGPNDCTGWRLD